MESGLSGPLQYWSGIESVLETGILILLFNVEQVNNWTNQQGESVSKPLRHESALSSVKKKTGRYKLNLNLPL